MNDELSEIKKLQGRPVAYYVTFARIAGSVNAGLMLSQAMYWTTRTEDSGWFYKSAKAWQEEVGLSRAELDGARELLRTQKLIDEEVRGFPAKVHYRVNLAQLQSALSQLAENKHTDARSLRKTNKQECRISTASLQKLGKLAAENQQAVYREAETTSDNNTENSTKRQTHRARSRSRGALPLTRWAVKSTPTEGSFIVVNKTIVSDEVVSSTDYFYPMTFPADFADYLAADMSAATQQGFTFLEPGEMQ